MKSGTIKLDPNDSNRILVWVGTKWKGIALEDKRVKTHPIQKRIKNEKALKLEKVLTEATIEYADAGLTSSKTNLSSRHLVSICTVPQAHEQYVTLEAGLAPGQMKFIILRTKSLLGPNALIIYSKAFKSGTEITTATLDNMLMLIYDGEYWVPMLNQNWTIS